MNRKQVFTIVVILIVGLAVMGIGYGLWSEILAISGSVATGNVDAAFANADTSENDHGKDVASCEAVITNPEGEEGDELTVTIIGGYPSYECWVDFDVISEGSVPIHIYRPEITPGNFTNGEEVTVEVVDEECYEDDTQVHTGEGGAACQLYVHVEQAAVENGTYTFTGEIEARQFNEPRLVEEGNVFDEQKEYEIGGVRFKSFGEVSDGDFYLGVPDLGINTYRVEDKFAWTEGSHPITFTYDDGADKIVATVEVGSNTYTLEYPDASYANLTAAASAAGKACTPADMDAMRILVLDRADGTVELNNVELDGVPVGDFLGGPAWPTWSITGYDFASGFEVTGDLVLGAPLAATGEHSKVELVVGCEPPPP